MLNIQNYKDDPNQVLVHTGKHITSLDCLQAGDIVWLTDRRRSATKRTHFSRAVITKMLTSFAAPDSTSRTHYAEFDYLFPFEDESSVDVTPGEITSADVLLEVLLVTTITPNGSCSNCAARNIE